MRRASPRHSITILVFLHTLLWCTLHVNLYASDLSEQRGQFNSAYQALRTNNLNAFFQLSANLQDYPLYHFLRYHYLKSRLNKVDRSEIEAFVTQYGDSGHGELLRQAWLYQLARQGDWTTFLRFYVPPKSDKNIELQCQYIQARLQTGQQPQEALQEAKKLWLVGKSTPAGCNPTFEFLYNSPLMSNDLIWERIALVMENGKPELANALAKRLPANQQAWVNYWQNVHSKPAAALANFNVPDSTVTRDILAHGIKRLAKTQFELAKNYWDTYQRRYAFSVRQIGEMQRDLALTSAEQNHPDALTWLTAVHKDYINENVSNMRIKIAFLRQDWRALADFITELPQAQRETPQWRYWHARAAEQVGQATLAQQVFKKLASERDYYGFLAADRLGLRYQMQDKPTQFTPQEEAQVANHINIRRAYEFYQLGMRAEGRREWQYVTTRFTPRQQIIAASIANRWGWYDRALATAAKAEAFDDLAVRFPMPYRDNLANGASSQSIDLAWVYGIVRQESLFMADARSHAGALGLMQLMPATGRLVAKKLGIRLRGNQDILEVDTNISLGTGYLRQMLDKFNGNYMLATAAYNAGPGRAEHWAAERGCLPADVWVELIPFEETRTYVRRVLFYTNVYEARLGQPTQPLRIALAPRESCQMNVSQFSGQEYAAQLSDNLVTNN